MNEDSQPENQPDPASSDASWLENTRQRLEQMGSTDAVVLQDIIREGLQRMEQLPPGNPLLAGSLLLAVAEAQFNLALSQENKARYLAGLAEGRRSCEEAARQALADGNGVACRLLPRAITLLTALYKAAPELRQTGLAESLQYLASQLDQELVEQKFLREQALRRLQTARLMLASSEGLSLPDRRILYSQAASEMLDAGELYLEAGDQDMLLQVQDDLQVLQRSLNDPALPLPKLALFSKPLLEDALLPPLSSDMGTDSRSMPALQVEQELEEPFAQTIPPPPASRRTSPLRWVISIAGLMVSCLMMTCSSVSLISSLTTAKASPTLDVSFYLAQTEIAGRQIALAQTSTAMAMPQATMTSSPTAAPSPTQTEPAAIPPTAAIQPTLTLEPVSTTALTGSQELQDKRMFDDFSSDALGWPVFDDGQTILKYENEAYYFQIATADYSDWAYMPVDFIPNEMEFDVQGPPGLQDGTFGVYCQYQDEQNYYYAEFDLQTNTYVIGQVVNGENTPLTEPDTAGQYWRSAAMLKSPPTATNHIGIGCYLNEIALFINNEYVDLVTVIQPFDNPGEAAFFVYTFHYADENGYTVLFDNVEVWQPVQ